MNFRVNFAVVFNFAATFQLKRKNWDDWFASKVGGGGMGDFKKWGDPNNGGRMTLEWGVDNPLRTTIHVFCNSFITRAIFSTQVF